MNILYVYAHPNTQSFNKQLFDDALTHLQSSQHQIMISDLYQQAFNPVASWQDFTAPEQITSHQYMLAQQQALKTHSLTADIMTELDKLQRADHIIFQFPLWWFSVPAILKGWFDRILVKGITYDAGKVFETGLLKGKRASMLISTHSPASAYQTGG